MFTLLLLALACGPMGSAPQEKIPAGLEAARTGRIRVSAEVRREGRLSIEVRNAPPEVTVEIAVSNSAAGDMPCRKGDCFELGRPLQARHRVMTDSEGRASWIGPRVSGLETGRAFVQAAVPQGPRQQRSQLVALRIASDQEDTDGDGLADVSEVIFGSDPADPDTDHDGLDDAWEAALRTNPTQADSDGDGLSDHAEWFEHGTHPARADTDFDRADDGLELRVGTDPRREDTDGDGVGDRVEIDRGMNPTQVDSDGDGLPDARDAAPTVVDTRFDPIDMLASSPDADIPDPELEQTAGWFAWSTLEGEELWIGRVDPTTRLLDPPDGRGHLLDTDVVPVPFLANGPEWLQGPSGPEVVYARVRDGQHEVMRGQLRDGTWVSAPLPDSRGGASPFGTLTPGDPDPLLLYCHRCSRRRATYQFRWRHLLDGIDHRLPAGTTMGRWMNTGEPELALQAQVDGVSQAVLYDTRTGTSRQVSDGEHEYTLAFSWSAPELDGQRLVFAVATPSHGKNSWIQVWTEVDGAFEPSHRIDPPAAFPFVVSPEPVLHHGRSYITFLASTGRLNKHNGQAEVWLAAATPEPHLLRRVNEPSPMLRKDPESLILGDKLLVLYTEVAEANNRIIHITETGL